MVTIEYLADRPEHLETIAGWLHDEWGSFMPGSTVETQVEQLRERSLRAAVPCAFVALDDDRPAGSASLLEHDMASRREQSPWLAAVYVHRDFRHRGIGAALTERVAEEARALGVRTLYLHTVDRQAFYERLGWTRLREETFQGWPITVMARGLEPR